MNCVLPAPLVEVRDLHVHFGAPTAGLGNFLKPPIPALRALDGVDLIVERGDVVGIVGESGSGKSTLGRAILGIQRATAGQIKFDGAPLPLIGSRAGRRLRRYMQLIPQDAAASLSPRLTVAQLLREVDVILGSSAGGARSVAELLAMVELGPEHAGKFPHELSGGQARRIAIARALAMGPALVVADEPTAGLDVSAVATIVNLLARLRTEHGFSYVIISHDLDVVAYLADIIAVMYLGKIVEIGPAEAIVDTPKHPYTRSLLGSLARPGETRRQSIRLTGDIPSPRAPPPGCRFHTRCPFARPLCSIEEPRREPCGDTRCEVACHFWREIDATAAPLPHPDLKEIDQC